MGFLVNFLAPLFSATRRGLNTNCGMRFLKHHFSSLNHFLQRFESTALSRTLIWVLITLNHLLISFSFSLYICKCGMYPDLGSSEKAIIAATIIITGVAPAKMYLQIQKLNILLFLHIFLEMNELMVLLLKFFSRYYEESEMSLEGGKDCKFGNDCKCGNSYNCDPCNC